MFQITDIEIEYGIWNTDYVALERLMSVHVSQ